MSSQQLSTNTFGVAKWIVSPSAWLGTHTTIQAAINAASAGDTVWIREGTYTENLTLKAGVNLQAYGSVGYGISTSNMGVIISGNATFSSAGTVSIKDIQLSTNAAAVLTVSGIAASKVNLINCDIEAGTTCISFTSSSASSVINISNCTINFNTTGVFYSMTSPGTINFNDCTILNPGLSVSITTNSAGTSNYYYCYVQPGIGADTNGSINCYFCIFVSNNNQTSVAVSGTGVGKIDTCEFNSGSGPCLFVTGTTAYLYSSHLGTTNGLAAIQGSGGAIVIYDNIYFTSTGTGFNGVTQSPITQTISDAQTINISGDANNSTVNVGRGAGNKTVSLGSTTGTSSTTVRYGTGNFLLTSNTNSAITAASAGQVNLPSQPGFLYTASLQSNATGDGTVYTVLFGTAVYSVASGYDGSSTLTAPITGHYLIGCSVNTNNLGTGHTNENITVVTTAGSYTGSRFNPFAMKTSGGSITQQVSVLVPMTAADTAKIQLTVSGSTKTVGVQGAPDTFFYAQLIS